MLIEPLEIDGAWSLTPTIHGDARGAFLEWLRQDSLESVLGHRLELAQANCSTSSAGVIRGIHYADVPPGQAKYVTCVSGTILDIVVDIRVGSPTYGNWTSVRLDDDSRRAVYVGEGLGHAFMAITDATVVYLCSTPYTPQHEHGIHPFDPHLGIRWPSLDTAGRRLRPRLSDKDAAQPSLALAAATDSLPRYDFADARDVSQAG